MRELFPRATAIALALGLTCALGACGSRSGLTEAEVHSDASVGDGCRLPSAVRGVVERVADNACSLEGRSADGRTHRMSCATSGSPPSTTFAGCEWVTDGVTVCECDEPDWAITCTNGVPLCVRWNLPFDFATDVHRE